MKSIVIFNRLIPFKGYLAITLYPFIFVRKAAAGRYSTTVNNHEHIHGEQQKELLPVGVALLLIAYLSGLGLWALLFLPVFLWLYVAEWLCKLYRYKSSKKAYRNISFEREAYQNEKDLAYISSRRHFIWFKYIFHN